MGEIANRIAASKSGLTRVIDKMIKAGLLRRERPEDDRRVVLVFITPKEPKSSTPPAATTGTGSDASSPSTSPTRN